MMFEILLGLVLIIFCLHSYFTRTFNYWKKRNVAGPQPMAFFGNVKDSALRKENMALTLKRIYDNYPDEKIIGMYRMTTPCLLLRDLDIIKHILIKDFDVFEDRGIAFSKEGLGANLFHADGETWRVLRHRFTPLFTTGKLKNMLHLIIDGGTKFLDYVTTLASKNPEQDAYRLMQLYTVITIFSCVFGFDVDVTTDKDFLERLYKVDKLLFSRYYVHELDMMYPGLLKKLNLSLFPKELVNFFEGLVTKVMKERKGTPSSRNDLMDLILRLRNEGTTSGPKSNQSKELSLEITDDIIIGQAAVFYAAGYETSASTLAFLLYEIAVNQDIQDKLITEIDVILNKYNGDITYEMLNELPYMDKVFDETLRKYPIGDQLPRIAKHDYTIPGTTVTVKRGQTVMVSVLALHRDEKLYPNPEVFDPERFDPTVASKRHACAYIPFGAGPRNCIGIRFAKFQIKVCLLKLLARYRVATSKSTKEVQCSPHRNAFNPCPGLNLNFISRH